MGLHETRRENLKLLIAACGNQREWSDRAGMPPAYVSQIVTGRRNLGEKAARKAERHLGLLPGALDNPGLGKASNGADKEQSRDGNNGKQAALASLRGVIEWESADDLPEGAYALVRRVNIRLAAGAGSVVYETDYDAPPLAFTTQWLRSQGLQHKNLVLMEASGDSMEGRIRDGDLLMVDRGQTDVKDGKVYALRYGQELRVKRLSWRYDGALILRSDNERYPEETVPPDALESGVEIIGRVVWRGGGDL